MHFHLHGSISQKNPTVKYLKPYNEVLFQGMGPVSEQIWLKSSNITSYVIKGAWDWSCWEYCSSHITANQTEDNKCINRYLIIIWLVLYANVRLEYKNMRISSNKVDFVHVMHISDSRWPLISNQPVTPELSHLFSTFVFSFLVPHLPQL